MSSNSQFTGIKGMNDMLPADAATWQKLTQTAINVVERYGYQEIRTPILENTRVFTRGVGEVTDIVEKEMYSFTDSLNGGQITLRPEGTSADVRSENENNLLYGAVQRLWYCGPMFRHERPQRGRYRQFHQFGAEALGMAGPDVDAEMLVMLSRLWRELGIGTVRLELNTLGALEERLQHRAALIEYFEKHQDILDEEARRRLHTNPLRILDTKNPDMQELVENAPRLLDYLGEEYCTPGEQKLAMLTDFPPLNYCCYPAVPDQYIVPKDNPWQPSEEAITVMEEFAEEADDKSMIKLLKYYRKHRGMRMSRYIAVKLHQTKHVRFIELLTEKLKQEAANYPNRSFGKEADERHQKLISQAKKEQAELYRQGIKSEVLREEPFVTAQDELDYKVYLMIYKWQGKNRGVNVRRIN